MGLGRVEPVGPANQGSAPVGRVELVTRAGEVVDADSSEVDRPMWGELRAVDSQPGIVAMGELREPCQGRTLARHIRRTGHREKGGGLARELRVELPQARVNRVTSRDDRPCGGSPWQEVGVMLDVE